MQGKEVPEPKAEPESNAGVDVSKRWLDAHVLPADERLRVPNTPAGIRQLTRWLQRFAVALVAVEATGKWHRALHRSLHAAGLRAAVTDPFRVRMFAKAHGILAKTDRLDARVLALFAAVTDPAARPPAPQAVELLQELVRGRASAVAERTALQNQHAAARAPSCAASSTAAAPGSTRTSPASRPRSPGRSPPTRRWPAAIASCSRSPASAPSNAALLGAGLPELGAASAKQIALLAGLAPIPDDSGERQGYRRITGGRQSVRNGLYLAALSAARCNPALRAFYRRKIEQGKAAKLALIAVARKLLVLANALIADNRTWTPQPPKHA